MRTYEFAKTVLRALGLIDPLRRYGRYLYVPQYIWYHKFVFGITNTKFDISYCVFRESFISDQYDIRRFLDRVGESEEICFIDLGRNHGFVFYYTMYYIMKKKFPVSIINYYGIDPSPLKFVYFNFHDYLARNGITINYRLLDRAVVFNGETEVSLNYGESNFGNFHVSGSSYYEWMSKHATDRLSRLEYIAITVDTIQFADVLELIKHHMAGAAVIVKIDCKNRTDHIFTKVLDLLSGSQVNYLVACEHDGSSGRDLSAYRKQGSNSLTASNVL